MSLNFQMRDDKSFRYYRQPINQDISLDIQTQKRRQILSSVVTNNVANLKELLDSPEWYKVTDKHGLSLLHIAILENSRDIFDFLLAISNFPLELVSDYGETALITAILVCDLDISNDIIPGSDYWAFELIKKGADIFVCDSFNYTTLSCAALKHHVEMGRLLIERGVDLNKQDIYGDTALHHSLDHNSSNAREFITMLLFYGCDTQIENKNLINPFEKAVIHSNDAFIEELLFYYTYDEFSEMTIHFNVLLRLAAAKSDFFIKFNDVIVDEFVCQQLLWIDIDYLEILIEKFYSAVSTVLPNLAVNEWFYSKEGFNFEKLEIFFNCGLRDAMIGCIQEDDDFIVTLLIEARLDEKAISRILFYLLSFGLRLTDCVLQQIFKQFGFCELFQLLLYMDVEIFNRENKEIFPVLIYDVTTNLEFFLENHKTFSQRNVNILLNYFCNSKLNEILDLNRDTLVTVVPCLVELARNVFRRYFITKFNISNSSSFYTLIDKLNISNVYKKIITYEISIY